MRFTNDTTVSVPEVLEGIPTFLGSHGYSFPHIIVWKDGERAGLVKWLDTETKTMYRAVPGSIREGGDPDGTVKPQEEWEWEETSYDSFEVRFVFQALPLSEKGPDPLGAFRR